MLNLCGRFVYIFFLNLAFDFLSVLRGHSFFSSTPQWPMTSDFEGFLYQILSITLFSYLNYILNYLFYNDYETSWSLALMFAFGWSSCGRKPECPEETHLSDLVATWPSHMPTPGIEPGSQRWEASALILRQPDSHICVILTRCWIYAVDFMLHWLDVKI